MYEDHYGFTGRPFQLTPDPRFWFDTAAHKKALSYLGYGLSQGEGFIVITGDVGAGKTTLVGHLLGRVDREQFHAISIASTQIEPDDLLRIVATGLDVAQPGATKADLLAAIEQGLHAVARTGRRTLLVVDEAQALPVAALEELRLLSNIAANGHALLQVFLLGQPEFRARLEGPDRLEQLRQRVIALHNLDPMTPDEVEPYMAHRLAMVGWNGRPRFTGEAFDALHAGSGGVPRLLNQLAGRVLLHGAVEGIETIDAAAVQAALADMESDVPQTAAEAAPAPVSDGRHIPAWVELPPAADGQDAFEPLNARIAALEERDEITPLTARMTDLEKQVARRVRDEFNPLAVRIAMLEDEVAKPVQDDVGPLVERIVALEVETSRPLVFEHPVFDQVPGLIARVDAVEAQAAQLAVSENPAVEQVANLSTRLALLETRMEDQTARLATRVASIEARLEDQDATLRRILTLLVDWVETGKQAPVTAMPISLRA